MFIHLHSVPGCCRLLEEWYAQEDAALRADGVPVTAWEVPDSEFAPGLLPSKLPAFRVPGPLTRAKLAGKEERKQ